MTSPDGMGTELARTARFIRIVGEIGEAWRTLKANRRPDGLLQLESLVKVFFNWLAP